MKTEITKQLVYVSVAHKVQGFFQNEHDSCTKWQSAADAGGASRIVPL